MPFPFLVTAIINIAISIGLSYISKKLSNKAEEKARKKVKQETVSNSGSILEIQYGEGQPRVVAIGTVVTAGQAVFDNTFGTANKTLQRVLKISDFRCSALSRVAIDNAWVSLGSLDATKGYPVTSGDYSGLIWVKFLDGSQTTADSYLTGNDNPDGRWSTNHKGIGCCYVIVTLEYDDEKLNTIPEMLFEVDGAPLYDFRKDTSVGGSGSHRWNDPTTWEFSENPILAEYNYRMGFYTGSNGSGHDTFCGMGMAQSELDYSRYEAAADICDEVVEGEARYRISTFLEADREHGDNLEDLMLSCAGMVVESVTGPYPILGASQTPVATLTNDDLVADAPVEFRKHRPVSEVVNTVSGVYSEPNFVYAETGYAAQSITAAVTADRRTIDYNLNLPMVPSKRQAEQLASIYLSENRYEATKTVTVGPKWQVLEVGDWITWTDDEDGAASRDYQIVSLGIASLGSDQPRVVQLTLQERDDSIYDGIGPVSPPTAATRPGAPTYLQELQSFTLSPLYVVGDDGIEVPAISVTWAAVTDPTVDAILIEWRPTGDDSRRVSKVVNRSATVAILQEGVVGATEYQVRNTIMPRPFRTTTPSSWSTVTTGVATVSVFGTLGVDIRDTMEGMRRDLDKLFERDSEVPIGITEAIVSKAEEIIARRTLKAQIGSVSASLSEFQRVYVDDQQAISEDFLELNTRVGDIDNPSTGTVAQLSRSFSDYQQSQAEIIDGVTATANQATADGLVKLEAISAPSGVTARFGTFLRTSTASGFLSTAAEYLEIKNGVSRKVIAAAQTVIADAGGNVLALFDTNGQTIDNARIRNLTAENIEAGSITADRIEAGSLTATQIETSTLILGDMNLSKGGFTYSRIIRGSGDAQNTAGLQDSNSVNHQWFLVHTRFNLTDAAGGAGSGTNQSWSVYLYWPGGSAELLSFQSINGTTREYFYSIFIDRAFYSNFNNGACTLQLAKTGANAGGSINNLSWLVLSGFQQA
jgi:hypothetical protein